VDAVERVLVALPEVHGAGTERIARACPYSKLRKPKKSWSFSGI
jgi:hypothetical protein